MTDSLNGKHGVGERGLRPDLENSQPAEVTLKNSNQHWLFHAKRRWSQFLFCVAMSRKVLTSWLSSEISFVILPLLVIAGVSFATDSSLTGLALAPEWSFASIVLCGNAIGKLIQKIRDRSALPYNLNNVARFILLPLILSVVVFAMATLLEHGVMLDQTFLANSQTILFCLAFSGSFLVDLFISIIDLERKDLPAWMSKYRYYKHLIDSLHGAQRNLRRIMYTLEKKSGISMVTDGGLTDSDAWQEDRENEIKALVANIEQQLVKIKLREPDGFTQD